MTYASVPVKVTDEPGPIWLFVPMSGSDSEKTVPAGSVIDGPAAEFVGVMTIEAAEVAWQLIPTMKKPGGTVYVPFAPATYEKALTPGAIPNLCGGPGGAVGAAVALLVRDSAAMLSASDRQATTSARTSTSASVRQIRRLGKALH